MNKSMCVVHDKIDTVHNLLIVIYVTVKRRDTFNRVRAEFNCKYEIPGWDSETHWSST